MALRLLQIGTGGCGRHWLKHVLPYHRDEVELVGLVDIHEPSLRQGQELAGLPNERCFSSFEEALTTIEFDAVSIVTTLTTHVPLAVAALNAGKHVLLEKPFAPSIAEAQQVIEVAERNQRVLLINQNYRYFPTVQAVKSFLHTKEFGKPGIVHIDFRRYANGAPREENRHYKIWQPLLVDMAIHHLDLMRYILERDPLEVNCHAWNPSWSNFVDPAVATITVQFPDNIVVNYRGSWVSTGPETTWGGDWRIECEKGEVRWNSRSENGGEYILAQPLGKEPYEIEQPKMHLATDWHGSLLAFVEAINQGKEPECAGRHNLKTLALVLATVESATSGRPIDIQAFVNA